MTRSKLFFGIGAGAVITLGVYLAYIRPRSANNFPFDFLQPPNVQPFQPDDIPPSQPIAPEPPGDTRSWRERFRSAEIPQIPDVKWQMYTDKEYHFAMEYPIGWDIKKRNVLTSGGVAFEFYLLPYKNMYGTILFLDIYKGRLREELSRSSEWVDRINRRGLIPDANINGIDLYIDNPDAQSSEMLLSAVFQQDEFFYSFGESLFNGNDKRYKTIIEHMIKTFRFVE